MCIFVESLQKNRDDHGKATITTEHILSSCDGCNSSTRKSATGISESTGLHARLGREQGTESRDGYFKKDEGQRRVYNHT